MSGYISVPINPHQPPEHIRDTIVPLLLHLKDEIDDLYVTLRVPPFEQDAMGHVFDTTNNELPFIYQKLTGIPITATFNNISIPPTYTNMLLFIENFRPYYERGLRRVILPFKHWMGFKEIKEAFPDLYVKNTILNYDYTPQDLYETAKLGYDFSYVDRKVLRDFDTYSQYPKVKAKILEDFGIDFKIGLLINEHCIGTCPHMREHYHFNNTRTKEEKPYFKNKISINSCGKWKREDPNYLLKIANALPLHSEIDHYLKYVDVLKLHGRDHPDVLLGGLLMMAKYKLGDEVLDDDKWRAYSEYFSSEHDLSAYLNKIRNCKFQCWDCDTCNIKERP